MGSSKKFVYLYVVQGYYKPGHGWEDLCASEVWKEAKADARAYRENTPAPIRIIHRRERIQHNRETT